MNLIFDILKYFFSIFTHNFIIHGIEKIIFKMGIIRSIWWLLWKDNFRAWIICNPACPKKSNFPFAFASLNDDPGITSIEIFNPIFLILFEYIQKDAYSGEVVSFKFGISFCNFLY